MPAYRLELQPQLTHLHQVLLPPALSLPTVQAQTQILLRTELMAQLHQPTEQMHRTTAQVQMYLQSAQIPEMLRGQTLPRQLLRLHHLQPAMHLHP